jgi:hypothetical protein
VVGVTFVFLFFFFVEAESAEGYSTRSLTVGMVVSKESDYQRWRSDGASSW